jgi:pterin-4a-carbinolamine dehydratase
MNALVLSSSIQSPPAVPPSLKAERIQIWLEEMPGWKASRDGRRIQRHFHFQSRSESLAFLRPPIKSTERTEVEFGGRGPALAYRGDGVTVSLWSHGGSFSGQELELARHLSQPS